MKSTYFLEHELSLLAQGRAIGETFIASTNLGNARAEILGRFFEAHLPARVSVQRGTVVDSFGSDTGELDLVVVDHDAGALRIGGESVALAESAVACIEVKSKLSKRELQKAFAKVKRVKALRRGPHNGFHFYNDDQPTDTQGPPTSPLAAIIAYSGLSWRSITKHIDENPDWFDNDYRKFGPDLIVLLGRGVAIKNDGRFMVFPGRPEIIQIEKNRSGVQVLIGHVLMDRARNGSLTYEPGAYFPPEPFDPTTHPWHR